MSRRPPDPVCVLRGHTSPISCVDSVDHFVLSGYWEYQVTSTYRTQSGDVAIWNKQTRHMEEYMPKYHVGGVLQVQTMPNSYFLTLEKMDVFPVVTEERESFELSTARGDYLLL